MNKGPREDSEALQAVDAGRKRKKQNPCYLNIFEKYSLFLTLRGCSDQTY